MAKDTKAADKQTVAAEGLQESIDEEQEQGFRGTKVDPTPNSAYTVEGVTGGEPTPETDPELRGEAFLATRVDVGGGQTKFTAEREPGESKGESK